MKKILFVCFFFAGFITVQAQHAYLGDALWSTLHQQENTRSNYRIIIVLQDQLNTQLFEVDAIQHQYSLQQRQQRLIQQLQLRASSTQKEIISYIRTWQNTHRSASSEIHSFWLVNMIVLDATPDLIWQLADRDDIAFMDLDAAYMTSPVKPVSMLPSDAKAPGAAETGLKVIKANALWKMGYTGKNRLSYSIDTGVWPEHPALRDRFLANYFPLSQCWFPYDSEIPVDKSGAHGTHTLGTSLGLDPATADTIGVAFNAYWICSDPVATSLATVKPLSDFMYAYEFALNPDGDTSTFSDIPDVINNSWGYDVATDTTLCDSYVSQMFQVVAAAGIANVFSAGNEGPGAMTISVPHHINTTVTNSFTVGALDANTVGYPIASFSSRGPSICGGTGSLLIKPEVSAPGVNVRSCINNNGYAIYSGTSMAGPHVTGAVLLLKEAFPQVDGNEILYALYMTATDLGTPGEDNTYGMGLIDVLAAYTYLSGSYTPVPPDSNAFDAEISEIILPGNGFFCDTLLTPQLRLRNAGTTTITEGRFHYGLVGSTEFIYDWTGTLNAASSLVIALPPFSLPPMHNAEFRVWFEADSLIPETSLVNNHRMARFSTRPKSGIPFLEDFEQGIDSLTWFINNPDHNLTWDTAYAGGILNSQHSAVMHFSTAVPTRQKDELITPSFDLSSVDSAFLKFDRAYQCTHAVYADTLAVWISTDCGVNFTDLLWRKGGATLQTYDTITPGFVPLRADQWQTETIDLSAYAGFAEVIIRFTGINKMGNNLFLDNIKVFSETEPLATGFNPENLWKVWPNPATDKLCIQNILAASEKVSLVVVNLSGAVCMKYTDISTGSDLQTLDISALPQGMYVLRIVGDREHYSFRFIKSK